jgi:hypothetical protein
MLTRKVMSDETLKEHIDYKSIAKLLKPDSVETLKTDFSEFTQNILRSLATKGDKGSENLSRLRLAIFCDYMIRFQLQHKLIKQSPDKLSKFMNVDRFFVDHFLNNFSEIKAGQSDQIQYNRHHTMELKLIYYILVTALILHDYKFNINPLARSLRLEGKTLVKYCQEMGCSVDEKKAKDDIVIVTLKAPLTMKIDKFYKNK